MKVYGARTPEELQQGRAQLHESVQQLNASDTACLLDYICGLNQTDDRFWNQVAEWMKDNTRQSKALTLAELKELEKLAEQVIKSQALPEQVSG